MSSFKIRTEISFHGDGFNLLRWSGASDRPLESSLIDACFGGGEQPTVEPPSPLSDRFAGWGVLGILLVLGAALFGGPTQIPSSQIALLDANASVSEDNRSIRH